MGGPKVAEGRDGTRVYEGVLLDLFGTLVDFRSTYQRTLGRILVENGLLEQTEAFREKWQRFVFQGVEDGAFVTVRVDFVRSLVKVLSELGVSGELGSYCTGVIDEMFESLRTAALFPEVRSVVEALEGNGVPWAVVSNVDEGDLQALLEHHTLNPTGTVSSEVVASYKPEAGPFERALEIMGLPSERVIHVGDSPYADVVGAAQCGLATVWVNRYDDTYPEDLPRPMWEFPDLSQVPRLISGGE